MFLSCFGTSRKPAQNPKFSQVPSAKLTGKEVQLLQLVYEDLAFRNTNHLFTYDNFIHFLNLKGLWSRKLFNEFDVNGEGSLTLEAFLNGISNTVKATLDNKIKLIYSFFDEKDGEGINKEGFQKMLLNYPPQAIKQILIHNPSPSLHSPSQSHFVVRQKSQPFQFNSKPSIYRKMASDLEHLDQQLPVARTEPTDHTTNNHNFDDELAPSDITSQIQQFVKNLFAQLNKNEDRYSYLLQRLTLDEFRKWIKDNYQLFKDFYAKFHLDLWSSIDDEPSYSFKNPFSFSSKYQHCSYHFQAYVMLIEDSLIICTSKKCKESPFKIVPLRGLLFREVDQWIQIFHYCPSYKPHRFQFDNYQDKKQLLALLKNYQMTCFCQKYEIGQVIGRGNFSTVYKCKEKQTGKKMAVKVVQREKLNKGKKCLLTESELLKVISHPSILKFRQAQVTKENMYLVTEYIEGQDLFQYVKKKGFLSEQESALILEKIIKATLHLHKLEILHRDLKPENIMLVLKQKEEHQICQLTASSHHQPFKVQSVKIIDFGLSHYLWGIDKLGKEEKAAGTPNYIAPEVLLGHEPTLKLDNFSIGSILYFMLRGKLPFAAKNSETTLINTITGNYCIDDQHWDCVSDEGKDLVMRLLEVELESRIGLEQALNHEWFGKIWEKRKKIFEEEEWQIRKLKGRGRKYSMGKWTESPPKTDRYSK